MAVRERPILHITPRGRLGNQMFQYMVARAIQDQVPDCVLSGVDLDAWGIRHEAIDAGDAVVHRVNDEQRIDIQAIVEGLRIGRMERVEYSGYGQRMENLPDLAKCQEIFRHESDVLGFGSDILLINIRGEEVVGGIHDHYTLVPVTFYQHVIAHTGLTPVFMGQLDDNSFTRRLRESFPHAQFVASRGAIDDFETIRRSKRILPAVSTFSWLAAWLSDADEILLPVTGFYNPMQFRDVDLLPLQDARYRFFLFPINYAAPGGAFDAAHAPMDGLWREVSPAMLGVMRSGQPRYPRILQDYLELFDRDYYVRTHPGVSDGIRNGAFSSPEEHYRNIGFKANICCFSLDGRWYSCQYPVAAYEVGQGDFLDFQHHFVAIGRQRGYLPMPPRVGPA
jgi:hypothetical protein